MRTLILVVSAILLSWAGSARASQPFHSPFQLRLTGPFAEASGAAPAALTAGLQTGALQMPGLQTGAPLKLMAEGSSGGGVQMESGTKAIIAILLSVFIGFGTGHFVLGDGGAVLFLALELGLIVASIAVYVAAIAVLAGSGGTVLPVFFVLSPIALIGYAAVRIWELVDCIFKSGIIGGGSRAAILPTGPELPRGFALQPMAANGPTWRF